MSFEDDLSSLDQTLLSDTHKRDLEHALKRRFEESALWQEHKRYHEEHGGHAVLRIHEEPIASEPKSPIETEPAPVRFVKIGRCECQAHDSTMELTGRGEVIAGIPHNAETSAPYGTRQGDTTAVYGASAGDRAAVYSPQEKTHHTYR